MLGSKHTFWQALISALVVFWAGILLGVYFENSRIGTVNEMYLDSQTDIFDFELSSEIIGDYGLNCNIINQKSVMFADKIYEEAIKLEKYDNSNKITKDMISIHRRYDLLRVMLWKDIIKNKEKCGEVNTVVYLYEYDDVALNKRSIQGAFSNFLIDVKKEFKDDIILIPIAVDTNIDSLDILREFYELDSVPVVFVNEEHKFDSIDFLEGINEVLG